MEEEEYLRLFRSWFRMFVWLVGGMYWVKLRLNMVVDFVLVYNIYINLVLLKLVEKFDM